MDPYRIFFPAGIAFGIAGTLLWALFGMGWIHTYPGAAHSDLMVGGFMFSFAAGFLMTAVPRFTGAMTAERWEIVLQLTLLLLLLGFGATQARAGYHFTSFVSFIVLAGFCARRFLRRQYDPPRFFVFVGLGLACGVAGSVVFALVDSGLAAAGYLALAKALYYHGMILSLVMGVGGQLLPALFGWKDISKIQIARLDASPPKNRWVFGLAGAFVTSLLIEGLVHGEAGRMLRAVVLLAVAIHPWKLHRRPPQRGILVFWLWISAWSLVIGNFASALFPAYSIHGIHLSFVGGFGLMILMIASRVTLAHGGYGLELETRSRLLGAVAILILVAGLTRVGVILTPASYVQHLAYASVLWMGALILWAGAFFPRMRPAVSKRESSC